MTHLIRVTDEVVTDLADLVDIARSITQMLDDGGLSRSQRARLMADYADAHAEINEMLDCG